MQGTTAGHWCAERGKRLCTGPVGASVSGSPWPALLRDDYVRGRCTDDRMALSQLDHAGSMASAAAMAEAARLYQADPSGSRGQCASEEGVFDLTETSPSGSRGLSPANNYDHVMKGCYWAGCYGGSPRAANP